MTTRTARRSRLSAFITIETWRGGRSTSKTCSRPALLPQAAVTIVTPSPRAHALMSAGSDDDEKRTRPPLLSNVAVMQGFASLFVGARLRGRRPAFYGITSLWRKDKRPFKDDLTTLIGLLADQHIAPRIGARLGLLEGQEASRRLEAGAGGDGKIVLLA
jgi:hypothetical protein